MSLFALFCMITLCVIWNGSWDLIAHRTFIHLTKELDNVSLFWVDENTTKCDIILFYYILLFHVIPRSIWSMDRWGSYHMMIDRRTLESSHIMNDSWLDWYTAYHTLGLLCTLILNPLRSSPLLSSERLEYITPTCPDKKLHMCMVPTTQQTGHK